MTRPNIVFIVSDDQRWDSLDWMPTLNGRSDWARFDRAYVHEPQCCPSRATILTGRYSHHSGVQTNAQGRNLDERVTVATLLHDAGYYTGVFGKYLNGYPWNRGLYVPPGWDEFVAFAGPSGYFDYVLNDNGSAVEHGSAPDDYSTDVLALRAVDFIGRASPPFFLYLPFFAPHHAKQGPPIPAPRHVGSCADTLIEFPSNFNQLDRVSDPTWLTPAKPKLRRGMDRQQRETCQTLRGLDEGVASVFRALEGAGQLDDTYVMYFSDNGYAFGEHRLVGKGHLFEEAVRVPLLARGPDIRAARVSRLTSNIDLTPTILDWADVEAPANFVDGRSFAPRLREHPETKDPTEVLFHGCLTGRDSDRSCGGAPEHMGKAFGVRTDRYKYIEYEDGSVQMFDLHADPWELTNLTTDGDHVGVAADLSHKVARLRADVARSAGTAGARAVVPVVKKSATEHDAAPVAVPQWSSALRGMRRCGVAIAAFATVGVVGAVGARMVGALRRRRGGGEPQ